MLLVLICCVPGCVCVCVCVCVCARAIVACLSIITHCHSSGWTPHTQKKSSLSYEQQYDKTHTMLCIFFFYICAFCVTWQLNIVFWNKAKQWTIWNEKNEIKYSNGLVQCMWSVCCWSHLAWVRLIRLWVWVGLHTGGSWAIMAPRINQLSPHTLEGEPLSWQHVPSARRITSLINAYSTQPQPVSCVGGPQQKPLMWRAAESTATGLLSTVWH